MKTNFKQITLSEWIWNEYKIPKFVLFILFLIYKIQVINKRIVNTPHNEWCTFDNEHFVYNFIKKLFPHNYISISYAFRNYLTISYYSRLNKKCCKDKRFFDIYVFNNIMNFKYHYLHDIVGCGGNGFVIKRNNYIIKILFSDITNFTRCFIEKCNKDNPWFPIVYHYTNRVICEELLTLYTDKCKRYDKILNVEDPNSYYIKLNNNRKLYLDKRFSKQNKEILKWGSNIFNSGIRENYDNIYDILLDNIGERNNGEIVLFDP